MDEFISGEFEIGLHMKKGFDPLCLNKSFECL